MFETRRGISVSLYVNAEQERWDSFIKTSRNATFMFFRDYMDYHGDRFIDHSLLISRAGKLLAVLPANLSRGNELISHQGLTFGGLVFCPEATLCDVLESFQAALEFLYCSRIEQLTYKRIPRFYSLMPDDEVDYAMFLLDARLLRRDCALVILQQNRLPIRKGRKSEISKARRFGVRIVEETDFIPFWENVLIPRLEKRYGVKPVHSQTEI